MDVIVRLTLKMIGALLLAIALPPLLFLFIPGNPLTLSNIFEQGLVVSSTGGLAFITLFVLAAGARTELAPLEAVVMVVALPLVFNFIVALVGIELIRRVIARLRRLRVNNNQLS